MSRYPYRGWDVLDVLLTVLAWGLVAVLCARCFVVLLRAVADAS